MKFSLLLLAVCGFGLAAAEFKLDLKTPINRIRDQILITKEKPAKWEQLPAIIDMALNCLLSAIPTFKVVSDKVPGLIKHYIETQSPRSLALTLKTVDWKKVQEAGTTNDNQIQELWEDLEEFMKTDKFVKIHEHIWSHEEFLDLIAFLHEAGYTEIYDVIKKFYGDLGRGDLPIPDGPNSKPYSHIRRRRSVATPPSSSSLFPLVEQVGPITNAECSDLITDLLKLLSMINDSNISEVLKAVLYGAQEVIGNSAMHILLLKIGEHQKGEFFHSTLTLEEMDEAFPLIQGLVLSEPGVGALNEILKQLTGLTLENQELFKYIVDLIQYLVWSYPFPQA